MDALRALLNAPPIAVKQEGLAGDEMLTGEKLKKKAAFEAWHSKKFEKVVNVERDETENFDPKGRILKEFLKILRISMLKYEKWIKI